MRKSLLLMALVVALILLLFSILGLGFALYSQQQH